MLTWCDTEQPWRPSQQEIRDLSQDTVDRMLAHNLRGQRECGWRP